jgi:hypothetical protein
MTPEVTKTVLNKIIFNVWIENGPVSIIIWPRDRASISVQQLHTGCPVKIRTTSFKYNFFCDRTIFKNLILK